VGFLAPKRHQMKHLDFDLLIFGTRGSEVQILSPRPFFLSPIQLFTRLRRLQIAPLFSGDEQSDFNEFARRRLGDQRSNCLQTRLDFFARSAAYHMRA